jgi:hypothetical protein
MRVLMKTDTCVLLYFGSGSGDRFTAAFLRGIGLSPDSKKRQHDGFHSGLGFPQLPARREDNRVVPTTGNCDCYLGRFAPYFERPRRRS